MKPTTEQQEWLKDYLYQVMQYRETADEIYDHILTALEPKTDYSSFEAAVQEVIDTDLSGLYGLLEMEKNCQIAIGKDVVKMYWTYFYSFFRWPKIIYTLGMAIAVFYVKIGHRIYAEDEILVRLYLSVGIFLVISIVPPLIMYTVIFTGKTKASYKDNAVVKIVNKTWYYLLSKVTMLVLFYIILRSIAAKTIASYKMGKRFWRDHYFQYIYYTKHIFMYASIIIFTIYIIHLICCVKLYKSKFKISSIA